MKLLVLNRVVLFLFFGMASCNFSEKNTEPLPDSEAETQQIIFHSSHEPTKANVPFSDVVQVGRLYFLSGQIGMDHSTRELVEGGIESETTQTLENIKDVLQQHGLALGDVVKATVILADMEDFDTFSRIYSQYLPQKPARTTFAAKGLARAAKIEIEVIAVKKETNPSD
ncbi:MAG: Rid family detoxifying hydrolase [Altibacter sp.]|uniref:RidA family protein n=1 Tax=Altibacter lentus TaxID=1223410 RepID=UPI00055516B3|nr:Rid family detoxifying hydrolase [Altibacter lentus]MCW8981127.1 Rid family detoxifying hydrolase [Altibacter sp.]